MDKRLMMIGFNGMQGMMTEVLFTETFAPSAIERFGTLESVYGANRGEPIAWVICALHCLGDAIEDHLRRLSERFPECHIGCFSEFPVNESVALRCKRGGSRYIVCNVTNDAELRRFKATVCAGHPYYPELIAGIGEKAEREILARAIRLPARQIEVLRYALLGYSVKATAIELGISDKTVSTHRKRYAQKLGTDNPWELFAKAVELNLISPYEVFRSLDAVKYICSC